MAAILGWFSDQRLGFAGEACEPVGIGGEGLGQDLERDLAVELGVCGAPDFAHAALAELGGDAVVRDGLLRAHSAVSGIVSLPGRVTRYTEVILIVCPSWVLKCWCCIGSGVASHAMENRSTIIIANGAVPKRVGGSGSGESGGCRRGSFGE
jgi:hypothetical protein